MADTPNSLEEYAVAETCIACDACCNDFGDVFKMNADHTMAIAFAPVAKGKYNPWDIIYDCPVDAISLIKGELPPPPADKKPASASHKKGLAPLEEPVPVGEVTDSRPWQVRWEEAEKRGPENYWERMKRYGQAYSVEETMAQILFRFALPEIVPEHPMKYRWNLPHKMPDYKLDIQLGREGRLLALKGSLEDQRVKRLCGIANSFPDRFLREIELPVPAKGFKHNYNPAEKVLDIVVDKK